MLLRTGHGPRRRLVPGRGNALGTKSEKAAKWCRELPAEEFDQDQSSPPNRARRGEYGQDLALLVVLQSTTSVPARLRFAPMPWWLARSRPRGFCFPWRRTNCAQVLNRLDTRNRLDTPGGGAQSLAASSHGPGSWEAVMLLIPVVDKVSSSSSSNHGRGLVPSSLLRDPGWLARSRQTNRRSA